MFEYQPNPIAVRGVMLAVCLALLAGCSGHTSAADQSAAAAPTVGLSTAPPIAPSSLKAAAGNAQARLTWSASSGAGSYRVKRSTTSGGAYTQLATAMSPSYTDATVSNGTTYYYVVTAVSPGGESADSAQASVTPDPTNTIPPVPVGLAATAGDVQVSLRWSASSGAASYHVKRATASGGPYTQLAAPGSPSYTDTSVTNSTTYYYVVSALDSAGESANSAQVSALPAPFNPAPATFGTWNNVTPSNMDLVDTLSCNNFGVETVQADPANPSNVYTMLHCQGIWKSTDYGATWSGPIETGTNKAAVIDCAGGITLSPNSGGAPTLYESCIRGSGLGFWKSVDGGVNWTKYFVAPGGTSRQDYYPPVVDPYNANHLLMAGHEMDSVVQSMDGGQTWTSVPLDNGMLENGGTGAIFFINTGNASTTSGTWLWLAQQSGGIYGTWRTTNSGNAWVKVDNNEHPHGGSQIYQPDNNGVVYMAGAYSALGWGVLRSTDYGQTWAHVGGTGNETAVIGTSKNVYGMFGWPVGIGGTAGPGFELAEQPGTGAWAAPSTPAGLVQGPSQIALVNDGTHNILVGAMHANGVWRYIEPD